MSKNNKKPKKIPYIKKIDAVVLTMVFVMFVVLIVSVSVSTDKYKENQLALIQDSLDILADNQRVQFENYISEKIETLESLAAYSDIYSMSTDRQSRFLRNRAESFGFHHMFVMSADGTGFYVDEAKFRDQSTEVFFQNVMDNDVYITEPFYEEYATTMTISVSIINEENQKVGALCGAMELSDLQQMFSENKLFLDGETFLLNRYGTYVAAKDMQKVYAGKSVYSETNSQFSLVGDAFKKRQDQTGTVIRNGEEYIANVSYLKDYDWVIVQCIKKDEVFKDLRYIDFWKYGSLAIVVIIILCVLRIALYWKKSEKRLDTDTLTGCNSRAAMESRLERLEKAKQYDITIIYMDLNKFKHINDTYGHDKGDEILCIFSNVLQEVFKSNGYVGRIGGDEFMVILLNTEEDEILRMCQMVDERLREESGKLNFDVEVSTSYGYATRKRKDTESLDKIIMMADANMYEYKEKHR